MKKNLIFLALLVALVTPYTKGILLEWRTYKKAGLNFLSLTSGAAVGYLLPITLKEILKWDAHRESFPTYLYIATIGSSVAAALSWKLNPKCQWKQMLNMTLSGIAGHFYSEKNT